MGVQVQPYHHGNLKQALLDKALDHLRLHGPDKISLRALARDVGVSQTAPYRHFADKTALLAALAAEGFRRLYKVSHSDTAADDSAAEALQKSGKAYIYFALDNPELYRLMFGPMLSPDDDFAELEALLVLLEQQIGEGRDDSELVETHTLFHQRLYKVFDNQLLNSLISMFATFQRMLSEMNRVKTSDNETFLQKHKDLLESLRGEDEAKVITCLKDHFSDFEFYEMFF